MSLLDTVENLVNEVRDQLDESNADSVTDSSILAALNRGQDYAFDVLARRYPEPILVPEFLTLVSGQQDYSIPENVFEDRILKVEIEIPSGGNSTYVEVNPISFRDSTPYESSSLVDIPAYFTIFSRKIRFLGTPTGTYRARIWKLRNPEKLVLPQGRITRVNTDSNYVILDETGDDLTTEADQLASYVNFIDGQTGELKGTSQIQIIGSDSRITFRSAPSRSVVLNRDIEGDISEFDPVIAVDDYMCSIAGTCVPYYGKPVRNFLVQYAVAELTGKLGGERNLEEAVLDKFDKQVDKTGAGRPNTKRIRRTSKIWSNKIGRSY